MRMIVMTLPFCFFRYEKNVTVESVLGRHAYQDYKEKCLGCSWGYRPDVRALSSGRGRAGISTRGRGRGNNSEHGGKVANCK